MSTKTPSCPVWAVINIYGFFMFSGRWLMRVWFMFRILPSCLSSLWPAASLPCNCGIRLFFFFQIQKCFIPSLWGSQQPPREFPFQNATNHRPHQNFLCKITEGPELPFETLRIWETKKKKKNIPILVCVGLIEG